MACGNYVNAFTWWNTVLSVSNSCDICSSVNLWQRHPETRPLVSLTVQFLFDFNLMLETCALQRCMKHHQQMWILRGQVPFSACLDPLTNVSSLETDVAHADNILSAVAQDECNKRSWAAAEQYMLQEDVIFSPCAWGVILFDRQTLTDYSCSSCTATKSHIGISFPLLVTVKACCSPACFPVPCSPPAGPRTDQPVNKYYTPGTAGLCLQSGDCGECTASIV